MSISILSHEALDVYKLNNYNPQLIEELALDCEELDVVANEIKDGNDCDYKFIKILITYKDDIDEK